MEVLVKRLIEISVVLGKRVAFCAIQLFKQRIVTRIIQLYSEIILGEIEKGRNVGKTFALCVRHAAFGDLVQKIQYMFFCDCLKVQPI
jgi:hypothetical protein